MASVGSITPTFFHYRTVYIAVEELCSVGIVFRWLAGHLQQICEMPFFFSLLAAPCTVFPFADVRWGLGELSWQEVTLGGSEAIQSWQRCWEELLMARSSWKSVLFMQQQSPSRHFVFAVSWECSGFPALPVCSLRRARNSVSETWQGGWRPRDSTDYICILLL